MSFTLDDEYVAAIKAELEQDLGVPVTVMLNENGNLVVDSEQVDIELLEFGAPGNPPTKPVERAVAKVNAIFTIDKNDIFPRGFI